jgi:hypothetical protein
MKKLVVLLMASLLLTGSAFAQPIDPDPNMMGFYWDMGATTVSTDALGIAFGYIVLTNPTFESCAGYEVGVQFDGGAIVFALNFPTSAINVGTNTNIIAGFGAPIATSEATVLGEYLLQLTGPVYVTLGNAVPPSIDGPLPAVVDGNDNLMQVGLSADVGNVCAVANDPAFVVVATENESWGGVKSLYR